MLSLCKLPKKVTAKARLVEADDFFAQQWLMDISFINKSEINKKFGRGQANIALARYFNVQSRGSNVSGKLTAIQAKDIDDLPEARQDLLLNNAINQNIEIAFLAAVPPIPEKFDKKSVICIQKENLAKAIDWCVDHRKFQYIKQVRVLMSARFWEVYYVEKTNRFFAIWPFCLTNWPSPLRKLILSGVDYDLTNSIGQFILEKVGSNISNFKEAQEYLNDPTSARCKLIEALDITTIQAKKVLHATTNGAGVTLASINSGKSSLLQIVTPMQATLFADIFKDLIKQLKQLRNLIAPNNKEFMRAYFEWEQQKTGTFFSGTGLIMHDGIDGCSLSTVIPAEYSTDIKISETRSVWDETSVIDRLITM